MRYLIFAIFIFTACTQVENKTPPPIQSKNSLPIAFRDSTDIFKYINNLDSAHILQGDTLEFLYGKFFDSDQVHLLIAKSQRFLPTIYSVYEKTNNTWNRIFKNVSEITGAGIVYQIDDYNFDLKKDIIFCDLENINGNRWYKLFSNINDTFILVQKFRNLSNPLIDQGNKLIRSQFIGGVFDEHSKSIHKITDTTILTLETVTSVVVTDGNGEPLYEKVCYYKNKNGRLVRQFCKKDNDSTFMKMVFQ